MNIDYSVYLVTDQFDYAADEFLNIIEEAIKGGATIIQIREKHSSTRDFLTLAKQVKQITDKYDVPLIVNDRIDIALAIDSAGVHLGQDDMPCPIARQILGDGKIIGVSAENYEDAYQAQLDGADYLGIGAIQPTPTKTDCTVISGEDLERICQDIHIPYVAIGGVKEDNTTQIINKYGFNGVAVVSAIMKSGNPGKSASNFLKLVNGTIRNTVYAGIYGVVVADALGVPFEFNTKNDMMIHPATRMEGYGTYNQPVGTWSDDSSLTLALADSLSGGINYDDIMANFSNWLYKGMYTPNNETFDVGNTTRASIDNYIAGVNPLKCGGKGVHDNGNGSLMRIMPIILYAYYKPLDGGETKKLVDDVSSLTHRHAISTTCCNIYNILVQEVLDNRDKHSFKTIIKQAIDRAIIEYPLSEYPFLNVIYDENLFNNPIDSIGSTGYVLDSLVVAIYCCYNSESYKDSVLKAINTAGDTDTNGAITGGLSALYYGYNSIPVEWLNDLANRELINQILDRFINSLGQAGYDL